MNAKEIALFVAVGVLAYFLYRLYNRVANLPTNQPATTTTGGGGSTTAISAPFDYYSSYSQV